MKRSIARVVGWTAAGGIACATSAMAADDVVIVYDASGSMWGQIDGVSKMEIARDVLADLVDGWDAGTNLGLVAYGHRSQGDCSDIETLIAPGPLDKAAFTGHVRAIKPVGKTPISGAVQHAADLLSYRDNPATVVLISDGVETCNADPCALSAELARQGVRFTAHVVGFDLEDEAHAGLSCIAENTGGVFVPAGNAAELKDALTQVQSAMVEPEPPAPEAPPEPALPEVTLTGPDQVTTGAAFDFSWSGAINGSDFITITAAGADEGKVNSHIRVKDASEGRLTAPGTPGLYELRYVLEEGRRTLASVPFEAVEGEVTLTGPDKVTTGAAFDFSWSGTINGSDFITITAAGADEGKVNSHIRVKDASEGRLTAPGTPGLYELRYVLEEGRRTLASVPFEAVEGEVTLTGPAKVTTGAAFDFSWSGAINGSDFITITAAGADEGKVNSHIRVKDASEGRLTAPGTPGLYELRYVLEEGRRTLASVPFEAVEGEVTLTGPDKVTTGAAFDFSWSGAINGSDFITITAAGADEGKVNSHIRVKDASEGRLTAPGTPGLYELRYVLEEGRRTLASVQFEAVEAEVGISGPGTVRAGTDLDVSWSSTINASDFVTIVPMGTDEGKVSAHIRAGSATEGRLKAPGTPGLYELRYVLENGRRTLASAPLEVVAADAPLDDGAGLTVPETAAPGETITVTWTGGGEGADQRIALARKDQPDFGWITANKIGPEQTMELTLPDQPGLYEVRYLDISGQKLLGRSVVVVK
ncbi:hypothetical protein DC366_03525 [Pelagivirga sediminicola]|uniref:VWFA domain-containing protein n=1 Tax=Pelagivirga sediminicola TaxID=2170575 RepID=A0A2T7GC44_9RHOB|nr:vWA domain-containing protein [Pelagivirga sediminicola]PVA12000.1 hypothetical protein DC366_03525 [Pelagivirga sediminicola]